MYCMFSGEVEIHTKLRREVFFESGVSSTPLRLCDRMIAVMSQAVSRYLKREVSRIAPTSLIRSVTSFSSVVVLLEAPVL